MFSQYRSFYTLHDVTLVLLFVLGIWAMILVFSGKKSGRSRNLPAILFPVFLILQDIWGMLLGVGMKNAGKEPFSGNSNHFTVHIIAAMVATALSLISLFLSRSPHHQCGRRISLLLSIVAMLLVIVFLF